MYYILECVAGYMSGDDMAEWRIMMKKHKQLVKNYEDMILNNRYAQLCMFLLENCSDVYDEWMDTLVGEEE